MRIGRHCSRTGWTGRGLRPRALRYVDPELTVQQFAESLAAAGLTGSSVDISAEYDRAAPGDLSLSDLAFLTRIHPLELWTAQYHLQNPGADRVTVLTEGAERAPEVYRWLLETTQRARQDSRIYAILEIDAFEGILVDWRRLGYPFVNIVPSVGTAIGSSGDRPSALAELTGIIVNGGIRLPTVRITGLAFGVHTPYEVHLTREPPPPVRVLDPAVAVLVRNAMVEVVETGTARRARGAFQGPDGSALVMGAKTGTGDNRSRNAGGAEGRCGIVRVRSRSSQGIDGSVW